MPPLSERRASRRRSLKSRQMRNKRKRALKQAQEQIRAGREMRYNQNMQDPSLEDLETYRKIATFEFGKSQKEIKYLKSLR